MSNYIFYLLATLSFILPSLAEEQKTTNPEQFTQLSADCEPLLTVSNCVNVMTGEFFQIERDFIGNTIDPIEIVRFYDSSNLCESFLGANTGTQFPLFAATLKDEKSIYALINEKEGFFLAYRHKKDFVDPFLEKKEYKLDPHVFENGFTNISRPSFHNQCNLQNRKASVSVELVLELGNGAKRIYGADQKLAAQVTDELGLPSKDIRLLSKEIKPNGNQLVYSYAWENGKPLLKSVETYNRTGSRLINRITFENNDTNCFMKSSCGKEISYELDPKFYVECRGHLRKGNRRLLKSVTNNHTKVAYNFDESSFKAKEIALVKRVDKGNGHFLEIEYDQKQRVKALFAPVGMNNAKVQTQRFEYNKSSTDVWNANNEKKTYTFDKNKRLNAVAFFDGKNVIKNESYDWYTTKGIEGCLKDKTIGLNTLIYCRTSYEYDANGNPARIFQRGNITGSGPDTYDAVSINRADYLLTEYEYSKDDNLLLKLKTPGGVTTEYTYLPGTNLKTSELIVFDGCIQKRHFWEYDDNGQIINEIVDDGFSKKQADLTNVTYRTSKQILRYAESGPAYGKPQITTESYYDNGSYRPLRIVKHSYNEKGLETLREFYNSNNEFCYSISKDYDAADRLIAEKDPVGRITVYNYDTQNNLIYVKTKGSGKWTEYSYDAFNRLIDQTEKHTDGVSLSTKSSYDALGRLIQEIDPYGQTTDFKYDRLGNKILVLKPMVRNNDGKLIQPRRETKYNLLNQAIREVDENGFVTTTTYNIFGQPIDIHYPDNSHEWSSYYRTGLLKSRTYSDGTRFDYTYDPEGKTQTEVVKDLKNTTLKQMTYRYKGSLLVETIDSLGCVTTFAYDGAGRKVTETIEGLKQTHFIYDDFDRVICKKDAIKEERFTYDWADRLLSKTIHDVDGAVLLNESYAYDVNDNLIYTEKAISESETAVTRSVYNSRNELVSKEDAIGNVELWNYNHFFRNSYGESVLRIQHTDAKGQTDIEEFDIRGLLAKKKIVEGSKVVAEYTYAYDKMGHLIKEQTRMFDLDGKSRDYAALYEYNSRGWVSSETEMPANKITRYTYDSSGRLIKKEMPDGSILKYRYDSLGRKLSETSSDGTINYEYIYDAHDEAIQIIDHSTNRVYKRTYDKFNRLLKEESNPGMCAEFNYDSSNRLTKTILPDHSSIVYHYSPYHLSKIERRSNDGKCLYDYLLDSYDLRGRLLHSNTQNITFDYSYDLLGRPTSIRSPAWSIDNLNYDSLHNLTSLREKSLSGASIENYTYDRFNHLIAEPDQSYAFDSLGNCLKNNETLYTIGSANEIANPGYIYNTNGCLVADAHNTYKYDAKNRLITTNHASLNYDGYDRCIQTNAKTFIYQGQHEIGSMENGRIKELRLVHPLSGTTYAIEIDGTPYFTASNHRGDICAFYNQDGALAQRIHYTAFGKNTTYGDSLDCPWGYANRRSIDGLTLYHYRLYNPAHMRWQTPDPLGFAESLNKYRYNKNNPNLYTDPDGRFVFLIPFFTASFGATSFTFATITAAEIMSAVTIAFEVTTATAIVAAGCKIAMDENARMSSEITENTGDTPIQDSVPDVGEKPKRELKRPNNTKGGPPRDPLTSDYLPDAAAEGNPHSTFGIRKSDKGDYLQGATFDENGDFEWRTDVTDHRSPDIHPKPHRHKARSPCGAEKPCSPIPWLQPSLDPNQITYV